MADADDYLKEGFDPRAVTVPRLRSILVTHNIDYPSTAKKPQLVALVTDQVLPQAPKLRAQRARAKRSSLGIVNAGSAEDTGTWDDQDLLPPPPSARRSKSPRKSSAMIKEEEEETLSVTSPRKRSVRSTSRQLSHIDDDDRGSTMSSRRSRRTVTPQIKPESESEEDEEEEEDDDDEEDEEVGEESVFTDDNPFQSGGSSPPQTKTPSSHRRRTTSDQFANAGNTSRRKTDGYSDRPRTPRTSGLAVPKQRHRTPEALMEPGEEFTPDAQLELEEAASQGEALMAPRKTPRRAGRTTSVKTPLFVLFMALLGAYLAWYRQEKIAVGYCGLGRPAKQILPPEIPVPDFLVPFVEPECEQCPQHAFCYEDFSTRCQQDFILQPHPFSLGGLVPLPPSCEPDGEKARRVQAVADKAVEELRDRRAKFECGDLVNEAGVPEDSPAIAEEELKQSVSKKRNKRLNSDEFDELWAAAIGEVTAREEVKVETETTQPSDPSRLPVRSLSSTSLARLSIACTIKRSIRLGMARYRLPAGLLISLILGVFYLRARYRRHLATSAQIPALVDLVLGRLASQKELGEEELDDPWLFLPNLRDDVLRAVHSLSERERIWQRVRAVVELNSNVRTSQREGRSGEVGRAWEWIGPMKGEVARRRRSGRVSWAPDVKSESPEPREMAEAKKWDEARPIY